KRLKQASPAGANFRSSPTSNDLAARIDLWRVSVAERGPSGLSSRVMQTGTLSFAGILGLVSLAGCGPGAAAEAIRPDDPTASGALGEAGCRDVDKSGEPLIVDWKPDQRGDLEIAMKEGVAIVQYSCKGIKLLKECHIEGNYGFIGMTTKEQVVRLNNE